MIERRAALKVLLAAPLIPLATRAEARDYGSPGEVLAEIDRLEGELDARLATLAASFPAAAALAASIRVDHDRHRRARVALRRRLRLAEAALSSPPAQAATTARVAAARASVDALRALAQDLVHAYAEGLPAIKDAQGVDVLARHMVDDARHLAVLQMWTETEQPGG